MGQIPREARCNQVSYSSRVSHTEALTSSNNPVWQHVLGIANQKSSHVGIYHMHDWFRLLPFQSVRVKIGVYSKSRFSINSQIKLVSCSPRPQAFEKYCIRHNIQGFRADNPGVSRRAVLKKAVLGDMQVLSTSGLIS